MEIKPDDVPQPHALDGLPRGVSLLPSGYEPHPDGAGGWRPANEANRGLFDVPCMHCNAPSAREVSAEYYKISIFHCPACGKDSAGASYSEATGWKV